MGHIEKHDDDNDDKIVKEDKALNTGYKKQFKGKCRVCGKIGHKGADCWTFKANKEKLPTNYQERENAEKKVIVLQAIATTATRRTSRSRMSY